MGASIAVTLLSPDDPDWPDRIDSLRARLGAPDNPAVFPAHFLRVVLPRIGGHVATFERNGQQAAVGFLLPRLLEDGGRVYTLRAHVLSGGASLDELAGAAGAMLPQAQVVAYDPSAGHAFQPDSTLVDGWDVGAPSAGEAQAIRALQTVVWGRAADNLYPTDIHSPDFGSVQSLVARRGGEVSAFLFGFYKFGGRPLPPAWEGRVNGERRLESQVLAVHPDQRGRGVATVLKARQAELARRAGIEVVNWTVDPLLWPNAVLNFGRLGALAFDFTPNMYPFRNEMNRVPASRLALTWLVNSRRVEDHLRAGGHIPTLDETGAATVNDGPARAELAVDAPRIAVEIPPDWVWLQAASLDEALTWRQTTDAVLLRYIGREPGRYAITGVAQEGERRFLLAERVTGEWLRAVMGVL